MAIEIINVGTSANDGTGDPLRDAFIKCNDNFEELDTTKQNTLTNPVTGTGANGQVAFWNATNTQTGDNGLFWDNTNKRLEIFNSSVGVGIAPLIVRNNVPYQSPFTQFIQVWQNSGGGVLASVRADGRIFSSNDVNSNYFVTNIGGNAGAPSFRASGGNGIFFPTTNTIAISTNSTERMRLDSNGNVGIGTTNPQARLDVRAQGALSTDIAFRVRNSADNADLLVSNGVGDFGIGVAPTLGRLHLQGRTGQTALYLKQAGDGQGDGIIMFGLSSAQSSRIFIDGNGSMVFNKAGTNIMAVTLTGVAIGATNPLSSAFLQVDSTTRGFLPPRMTNAQRLAIASPAVGLMVYCTDVVEGLYVNKSTGWTFII
jgi:hypothetical protein